MRVIGTAGHVDHGKSTLVEALTGIHPDRLKEEREREMTIDLGFAWLTLPGGEEVGIVDVPGHRDFIENMLAGIGGIDAVIFVVAADEGVMPQTREHLAIIDLLQIGGGIIALTKIDLVDDLDWLELVESDLRQTVRGTVLESAPILKVSSRTGAGLKELETALGDMLQTSPVRPDYHRPRLSIDRVFSIAGFGSVVTGTLGDGILTLGDEIEIYPQGLRGRVRGLQSHKRKEEIAFPGSRTAVNISGIAMESILRGNTLALAKSYQTTLRLDTQFRLLPDASAHLKHNLEVKLFLGADEVVARARLLGVEELFPGETGWLQLELNHPVVAVRGDRYILRRPSPGETLGGGIILDPHPSKRHKRYSPEVLNRLETLSKGTPTEVFHQALVGLGIAQMKDVIARSSLEINLANKAVSELIESGQMINLEIRDPETNSLPLAADLVASRAYWENLAYKTVNLVQEFHQAYPLRAGISREELKSRLKAAYRIETNLFTRLFNLAILRLKQSGLLCEEGPLVYQQGHLIIFTAQQQNRNEILLWKFAQSPYAPPSPKECQAEVGDDVYQALLEMGRLTAVSQEVVFRQEDYNHMVNETRRLIQDNGRLTVAQWRDRFNTSRKYALAFLEHLDSTGLTIREGDTRRLK
jgi:selenocysteine-specific elongation factor